MNTNASIKKESKVDRARRRLEIAIENLDSIILNYSPNSNDAKSEVPHLTTEVKRLGEELNILTKKNQGPICILVGPEGDFSEKERQLIIEKKEIFSLSLANNILRAETAAIASVTIVNYHLNLN